MRSFTGRFAALAAVACALLLAWANGAGAQDSAAEVEAAAVVAAVEATFDAMRLKDSEALAALFAPGAQLMIVGGQDPTWRTSEAFVRGVSGIDGEPIERMWDPVVRIDGDLAELWAPYDFYVGERFSHCGVDAVHLVRHEGRWKIAVISYTRAQPPACEMHPAGPPGEGG